MRKVTIIDTVKTRYKDYALIVDKKRVTDELKKGEILSVVAYGDKYEIKIKGIEETFSRMGEALVKTYKIFVGQKDSELIKNMSFKGLEAEVLVNKGMNFITLIILIAITIGCLSLYFYLHRRNNQFIARIEYMADPDDELKSLVLYGILKYAALIIGLCIPLAYIINIIRNKEHKSR